MSLGDWCNTPEQWRTQAWGVTKCHISISWLLPVDPGVTTWEWQNGFSWYLVLGILSDICWHIPILVKIKCKALRAFTGIAGTWRTNVYCGNPSREGLKWLATELLARILIMAETWACIVTTPHPDQFKWLHRTDHKTLPSTVQL